MPLTLHPIRSYINSFWSVEKEAFFLNELNSLYSGEVVLLYLIAGLFVFLFGLTIGSFMNVLVYRIPRDMSVAKGYSLCPDCGHRLFPRDLVPVFSWLFLRRRCRYCQKPISARYPIVELSNALLWVAVFLRYGFTVSFVPICIAVSCLVVAMLVDWEHQMIPDSMNLGVFLAGVALLVIGNMPVSWLDRLIGMGSVSVVFLLIVLISRETAMGMGDVKLMAAVGFFLGWKQTLLVLTIGAISGSVISLIQLRGKKKKGALVPFGSFLAGASILSVFIGEPVINWYLSLLVQGHTH